MRPAFTLVETLIATTLGMLVLAVAVSSFQHVRTITAKQKSLAMRASEVATWQRQFADDLRHLHHGCLYRVAVVPDAGAPRWLDLTWMRSAEVMAGSMDGSAPGAMPYRHDLVWVRWRWDARTGSLLRSTTGPGWWEDALGDRCNPFDNPTRRVHGGGAANSANNDPATNRTTWAAALNGPMPRRAGWEQLTQTPVSGVLGYFSDRTPGGPLYLDPAKTTATAGWFERDLADNDWRWVPWGAVGVAPAPGVTRGFGYPWVSRDHPQHATTATCPFDLKSMGDPTLRIAGDEVMLQRNLAAVLDGVVEFQVAWSDLGGRTYAASLDWDPATLSSPGNALDTIVVRQSGRDTHGNANGAQLARRNRLTISGAYLDGLGRHNNGLDPSEKDAFDHMGSMPAIAPVVLPAETAGVAVNLRRPTTLRVHLALSDRSGAQRMRQVAELGRIGKGEVISRYTFSIPVCGTVETP
jgi:hypothetical protein